METKSRLNLDSAKRVAAAAQLHADAQGWDVVIAILDDGGHLMYLQRDQAQVGSIDVAISKARSAVLFKRPTLFWEDVIKQGRHGYLGMPGIIAVEGGVPLIHETHVIGAIGVSGVSSDQDGLIAQAGVAAL